MLMNKCIMMSLHLLRFAFPILASFFFSNVNYKKKVNFVNLTLTNKQGEELRKQIGASAYIECSAKTQQVDKTTWKDIVIFVKIIMFLF